MSPVFCCQGICLNTVCRGVKVLSPDIFGVEEYIWLIRGCLVITKGVGRQHFHPLADGVKENASTDSLDSKKQGTRLKKYPLFKKRLAIPLKKRFCATETRNKKNNSVFFKYVQICSSSEYRNRATYSCRTGAESRE